MFRHRFATFFASRGGALRYGGVGSWAEVTQRLKAFNAERQFLAAAAELADERFRMLVERVPAITYIAGIEPGYSASYISPAVETILGYSPDEWCADPISGMVAFIPRTVIVCSRSTRSGVASGASFRLQYRMLHRDGRVVWILDEAAVSLDGDGRRAGLHGVMTDITELVSTRTDVGGTGDAVPRVVEKLPGVVYTDRVGGNTVFVSEQIVDLTGYTAEESRAPGMWQRMLHPEDRARAARELSQSEARGGDFESEYRLIHRDGRVVWVRDRGRVVTDPDTGETMVHGLMLDITSQRIAEGLLADAGADRARSAAALSSFQERETVEATAQALCELLVEHTSIESAIVYALVDRDTSVPLGLVAPSSVPVSLGQALPRSRARHLYRRAADGPWVEAWTRDTHTSAFERTYLDSGLVGSAYVPFSIGGRAIGVLAAGSWTRGSAERIADSLPWLTEYSTVLSALIGQQLLMRSDTAGARRNLARMIARREFHIVFQPVRRLRDRAIVGYEALTRFADGAAPSRRFFEAAAVGMDADLARACLGASLHDAGRLPGGHWLSINVSPAHLAAPWLKGLIQGFQGRLLLEVTEESPIDDYERVREAVADLGPGVELAVDDAGAGFASLRHILELQPNVVKLDIALIRQIQDDPARQALVAGMVHFANEVGIALVAEGIEHESEADILLRLGVKLGQGYLFGRPAPVEELAIAA